MKAFKCDRCSRFQEDDPVAGVIFKRATGTGSSHSIEDKCDLCDECQAQLVDWRDYYKTNPKPEFGKKGAGQ